VYGRKPIMIALLLVDSLGGLLLPLSRLARRIEALEIVLVILWISKSAMSSLWTHSLIAYMMLVDWTEPSER
jgi:hypothetical protein